MRKKKAAGRASREPPMQTVLMSFCGIRFAYIGEFAFVKFSLCRRSRLRHTVVSMIQGLALRKGDLL